MPRPKYFLPTLENLHIRDRGNNPHWEMPNAIYSITFRLHDSLPAEAMERLHRERKSREQRALTSMERMHIRRAFEREMDEHLDRSAGKCELADPRIAREVIETLHLTMNRYDLLACCVMPNHVHVLIQILGEQSLARIVHRGSRTRRIAQTRSSADAGRSGSVSTSIGSCGMRRIFAGPSSM